VFAINRILCPIDVLDPARATLGHALSLASQFDAHLEVLNVWSFRVGRRIGSRARAGRDVERLMAAHSIRERLARLVDDAVSPPAVHAAACALEGDPLRVILGRAVVPGADLIVVGKRRAHTFGGFISPGIAEKIARDAPCAVLSVGERGMPPSPRIERILVPVDFSASTETALSWAATLAERYAAGVELLHVSDDHHERPLTRALEEPENGRAAQGATTRDRRAPGIRMLDLAQRARLRGAKVGDGILLYGSVASRIIEFARAGAFDMIVMGMHARRSTRWFRSGVVAAVRRGGSSSLLSVRATAPELELDVEEPSAQREFDGSMSMEQPGAASA
jgi:nucleotide-binding universal stress UspA family protein